jgi:tetratricopeptide (TPR) repeat protein
MQIRITRRLLVAALVLCALLGSFGVWVLLHPASVWVQPWRAERSDTANEVIFGPYPVEADFRALKRQGVTTIISLLDANLPYEKILLAQERERAERHGMQVLNFPMASVLGQSFGKDYLKNSQAAARAARDSDGIAYIHCYLGLHRARNVQIYLDRFATSSTYAGSRVERPQDRQAEARGTEAFRAGKFAQSLAELQPIADKGLRVLRLEAWANYRLGRIDAAQTGFEQALARAPDDRDALTGLGYCALQSNHLDVAEQRFSRLLSGDPGDPSVLEGLAHVRFRQGQHAEAQALFERALAKNPDNLETRDMLDRLKRLPQPVTEGS